MENKNGRNIMNKNLPQLVEKLKDERSKKVIFVSHCILNENTRYLGGAFCSGINSDLLRNLTALNCGIVQMPCPEQIAWGGVLKKFIWLPFNSEGRPTNLLMKLIYPLFIGYTQLIYSRIALKIVKQIQDYLNSDFEIIGLVGIDGSPTCGVNANLEIKKSFQYIAKLSIDSLDRAEYNRNLYKSCLAKGNGMFIKILTRKLNKRRIDLKKYSINLIDEMNGQIISLRE